MSSYSRYRFSTAWLPAGWYRNVVVSVDAGGDIADVATDDLVSTARSINGAAIPGMPNVHSHAFQRSMIGLAERGDPSGDSFWTWRETMYEHAAHMTPETLAAIAAQLYADMLKAGYTAVCEFHYLHNQPDGQSYDDPIQMCRSLIDAARTSGIGLTLLPTLYQTSDFGAAPPTHRQRRFVLSTRRYLDMLAALAALHDSETQAAQLQVGVALHSLRAVPPDALLEVLDARPTGSLFHIHVAEQEREVASALEHLGCRPIEWLLEHVRPDEHWCLVHATHASAGEVAGLADSGAVVGLCPATEGNLGDGFFPFQSLIEAGGRFGVGSDSQICLSPAEELRWLDYQVRLQRRYRNVVASAQGASSGALLWRQACESGALACGRRLGALEVGRRADIVVLDQNSPLFAGRNDDEIIDTFVFASSGNAVRDVMVGGRWLVQDGRHYAETALAAGFKRAMQNVRGCGGPARDRVGR